MDGGSVKPRAVRMRDDDSAGKNEKRRCCRYTVAIIQGIPEKIDLPAWERY